jgi:pheromone shutdown protein TraB
MGITSGEQPGAELLAAIEAAEDAEIPIELIDRDVVITLRRAWARMGLVEKWRVLNALLWDEDDDEDVSIEEMLGDSDLLSKLLEDARAVAPRAGEVLIDERDAFLAGRIQQIRGKGKILAVVGAGHLKGVAHHLGEPAMETTGRLAELKLEPKKPTWPKAVVMTIPLLLLGAVIWMVYNGEMGDLRQTAETWLVLNALLAGLGVLVVSLWLHSTQSGCPDRQGRAGLSGSRRALAFLEEPGRQSADGNGLGQPGIDARRLACWRRHHRPAAQLTPSKKH